MPGQLSGRKHILSILVENKPGVLARVAGLFSRRGFNIDTLAVGPTDDPSISRITLTLDGAVHPIDQVTKQLHKLVNVLKIRDMEPEETVAREMAMFKVSSAVENRAEIIQFAEIFRAKIVDVSRRTMTIEVTGSADKIEAFERMIRPHGLIEMVRTGEIAIARGQRLSALLAGLSAARRARGRARGGARLVSVTVEVEVVDPCAAVFASRLASDRWFCWEQPDREFALAGAGRRARGDLARARSASRDVAAECLRSAATRSSRSRAGCRPGAGPVWLGGFAFDPDGGGSSTWSSLAPASLVLPELSICRSGERRLPHRQRRRPARATTPSAQDERARGAPRRPARRRRCRCSTRTRPPGSEIRSARPPGEFEARGRGRDSADRGGRDVARSCSPAR